MKRWVIGLPALALAACTSPPVVEPGAGAGEYTLHVPADVFLSRPMLAHHAAVKAAILCPRGYTILDKSDTPSEVLWHIRCEGPAAG
jgi:hypothetical protein